jgi:hypothetical protein
MAYQISLVELALSSASWSVQNTLTAGDSLGSFSHSAVSAWFEFPELAGAGVGFNSTTPTGNSISFSLNITTSGAQTIEVALIKPSSGEMLSATYTLTGAEKINAGQICNITWEFDCTNTGDRLCNLYLNGSLLTPTAITWSGTTSGFGAGTWFTAFFGTNPGGAASSPCETNMYFEVGHSLISPPACFISGGNPVDPGANGQNPTGVTPLVFLTVTVGQPAADILNNQGSGAGPFAEASGGVFALCPNGIFPPTVAWLEPAAPPITRRLRNNAAFAAVLRSYDNPLAPTTSPAPSPPPTFGPVIIGDYRNGNIYAFDLDAQTDAGTQRKWLRTWRALKEPTTQPTRFSQLRIDMQTGADVPDGTNPQVVLRWSDDGGHAWSIEWFRSAGATGETTWRVVFNRLGSTKRATGLDRIFELSSTDPFRVALLGAVLKD